LLWIIAMEKLFIQAISKFLMGIALVGLLIFLPAGTFMFFNGWLFMGILWCCQLKFATLYSAYHDHAAWLPSEMSEVSLR
jgi:hypothetical protein